MSRESWQVPISEYLGGLYPDHIDSIIDLACGISCRCQHLKARIRVGVDVHKPYLLEAQKELDDLLNISLINYDIRQIDNIVLPKSFDAVLLLDVIEHNTKEDALMIIRKAEAIAKKCIVIECPRGFIPQNKDIQNKGGDKWQTHRSGWEVEELEALGYTCFVRPYVMQDIKRHTDIDNQDVNIELIDAIKLLNK